MTSVLASHAAESVVTLPLGGFESPVCDVPFQRDGFTLTLTRSALGQGAEGHCSFHADLTKIHLYPGNLRIDLGRLPGRLIRVEADVVDACGAGCTRLILASGTRVVDKVTNLGPGTGIVLKAEPVDASVDTLYLSSYEGAVREVRLILAEPPAAPALSARRDGSGIVLSWSESGSGCTLQQAGALGVGDWKAVPAAPIRVEPGWEVRLPASETAAIFRLACP